MKVLFVCPFVPWPPEGGGKIRTYHLIRSVQPHAEVHLRILHEPNEAPGAREALEPLCASLEFFDRTPVGRMRQFVLPKLERWFHSKDLIRHVARDLDEGDFNLVHLDELLLARIVSRERKVPVIQHHHKLDTVLYDNLSIAQGPTRHFDLWKLNRLERESARRYRHHLLCSHGDAEILRERHGALDTGVLPSGFDPEHFRPSDPPIEREPDHLLFLGSMDYGPNVDGVRWFVRDVLPRIVAERPSVRLSIVGANPVAEVRELHGGAVEVVGRVDTVTPWLERAATMVVPLRIGGGTRLKIVEALALATPVVSTNVGAEGLGLKDGQHLDLVDSAEAFARVTVAQLTDRARAIRLGARGHAFAHDRYRWDALAEELAEYWEHVAFTGRLSPSR